ncbi:HEAT repeat domain-containing protein [Paraliomyxa miuraensis]|uniref:HEAT repeat domain-containing protein n=1 Tax=Paraliomyxa miuraensis TaxID=376150 RepID=UPI002253FEC0|nr:HEAT repeat domain-containing protein [Paraliomyxa miuraensis]MCX4241260.1 HEAT repeat domain-containing protein [Paraliomyxa miuraensis]
MGLLDKMFGGGTNLELRLDTEKIPEGGTLCGTVSLSGGKKPLRLTALKVRLVYVKVEKRDDSPLPNIEMQVLIDNTIAANADLPPGQLQKYDFSFKVPTGTDPDGEYRVMATADIPKVKDPSAEAKVKVLSPDSEGANRGIFSRLTGKASEDEILAQFPGLMSSDEDEQTEALSDLNCAAYDDDNNFVNIAGHLGRMMASGTAEVRAAALEAWGTVLNNRAKPEHIQALVAMANDPSVQSDRRLMREVVTVAAKFAEEGAAQLVHWFAQHQNPEVRKEMADRLRFDADDEFMEKRAILTALANDPDAGVRASAIGGLSEHNDEAAMVQEFAQRSMSDPSPEVQAACLSALTLSHHHGFGELVFSSFQQHLQNPHVKVRKELADSCHWLPSDPRLAGIVHALLSDPSPEVRRAMAWQGVNMGDHPQLAELFMRACDDPDEEVAQDALRGMGRLMGFDNAAQFYRHRMAARPTESTYWGVYYGICSDLEDEPAARALMQELTRAQFADVASSARESLEDL